MAGNAPHQRPSPFGPGGFLTTVPLHVSGVGQLRHLEIHRSDRMLALIDITTNPRLNTSTSYGRDIELDRAAIVPLYTLNLDTPEGACDIRVVQCEGKTETTYPLRDRRAALRFQKHITGFRTVDSYRHITCSIVYEGKWWGLLRDGVLKGRGELQLCRHKDDPPVFTASAPIMASDSASNFSQPLSPHRADSGVNRRLSSFTSQSAPPIINGPLIRSKPQKPVMLVFLRGQGCYIMLRVGILDLNLEGSEYVGETQLILKPQRRIKSMSVLESEESKWDIGAMMRRDKSADIKKLKCCNFSLIFSDATSRERFLKRLVYLHVLWHKANNPMSGGSTFTPTTSLRSLLPTLQQTSESEWINWRDVQIWSEGVDRDSDGEDADTASLETAPTTSSSSTGRHSRVFTPPPMSPPPRLGPPSTGFSAPSEYLSGYTIAPSRRSRSPTSLQELRNTRRPTGWGTSQILPTVWQDSTDRPGSTMRPSPTVRSDPTSRSESESSHGD